MDPYTGLQQEGHRTLIISPLIHVLPENKTILKFFVYFRNTTGGLRLLASAGNHFSLTFEVIPYNMTKIRDMWWEEEVLLPIGSYKIIFEATIGSAFISDLVLDGVRTFTVPGNQSKVLNVQTEQGAC